MQRSITHHGYAGGADTTASSLAFCLPEQALNRLALSRDQGSRREARNVVGQPYDDCTNHKYKVQPAQNFPSVIYVPKRQSKYLTAIFTEDPDAALRVQRLL